ncbi:hypothetical protein WDW37_04910 [Bdellovibrionota bacterium FG-1]
MLPEQNMDFTRRKLPKEAALNLRICPVASVQPYALMLAPVYVFMRVNEKFVSIKGPLDFFTPEELDRFKSFESFFLPACVDTALPFRDTARQMRMLLNWTPVKDGEDQLPPAPYEISDAVLRMLGPLWGEGEVIEPFFAAIFANELCEPLPQEVLKKARDRDVLAYEQGLLRSGWAVFLALHLGYCNWEFLNAIRTRVFEESLSRPAMPRSQGEVDELVEIVFASLQADPRAAIQGELFARHSGRAAQKLTTRLQRVQGMIATAQPVATIFGERGFVDV